MRRYVLCDVLLVNREHPNVALSEPRKIDDPIATALATSGRLPTKLPDSAGARDDVPGVRICDQGQLELTRQTREKLRLDEAVHGRIIRQCRIWSIHRARR